MLSEDVIAAQGVRKKVLSAGINELPDYPEGSKIIFHFQTQKINENGELREIDDSKKVGKPMELILGKKFKMPIWEECIKSMRVTEIAEFKVKKNLVDSYPLVAKGYREFSGVAKATRGHCCGMMSYTEGIGHNDLNDLIRNPSDLLFKFELIKVERPGEYEKESWSMDPEEKLKSIPKLKEVGNNFYKEKKYQEAAKNYTEALGRLEQLLLREKPGDEEYLALEKMKFPILLNYAQCKLVEKDYYPVIDLTSTVLEKDPNNVKALYRRGKAYMGTWDLENAQKDFMSVAELDPTFNNTIQKELKNISAMQKEKDEDIKSKLYGKVFKE